MSLPQLQISWLKIVTSGVNPYFAGYLQAVGFPVLWGISEQIFCFDSSTITLFVDIFKGAGHNTLTGKKKGGLKIRTKIPVMDFVPDLVTLSEAACNDKTFPGQLEVEKGAIYLFDKGYANYQTGKEWIEKGVFFAHAAQ